MPNETESALETNTRAILDKIRRVAINWLSRRDYAQQEITKKLQAKGFPLPQINTVMLEFIRSGLINDQRFAENYVYYRREHGYGPLRISQELRSRGISREIIAQLLEITNNLWFTKIRIIWQKHFKNKVAKDFKTYSKQIRFLQSRGYTREQIACVLPNIANMTEQETHGFFDEE